MHLAELNRRVLLDTEFVDLNKDMAQQRGCRRAPVEFSNFFGLHDCMFVPVESTSTPAHPMPSTKEITIVCLLFVAVIVFQVYVFLKLDDPQNSVEEIDKERREEERRRRNDLLMKALSAF